MSTVLTHAKLALPSGLVLMTPLTRHCETMQLELDKLLSAQGKGMHLAAENVRAALRCGLLQGAVETQVDEWEPAVTLWVSSRVSEAISKALDEVPPE